MKNFLLVALILVVLAALAWFAWMNWGAQLSQVPGQLSATLSRMLMGISESLAGFGRAVSESFRMPGR